MEVIDIGLNDLEPISLNFNDSSSHSSNSNSHSNFAKSVNFGPGIELLMNDKKKSSSNTQIDLGDLNSLENELNELSGAKPASSNGESKTLSGLASDFFGFGSSSSTSKPVNTFEKNDSNLGSATAESIGNTKTWDGFQKLNEIPLNSESSNKMTDREKRRKKRLMIKKLEEWYDKELNKHSSHFTIDSNYE